MFNRTFKCCAVAAAALGLAAAGAVQAQGDPSRDEVRRLIAGKVDEALPPVIGADNAELVDNLLNVELGTPLSKSFDFNKVRTALFGRAAPNLAPDCPRTGTPVGEPDQDECTAAAGQQTGGGEYKAISFSKNLGVGNIKFLHRPVAPKETDELDPMALQVKLSDGQAFETALKFLTDTLGVAPEEIANPPAGVPLPVRSLAIGGAGPDVVGQAVKQEPIVIRKVVFLPRGLNLPKPIQDPQTGRAMTKVPAPGQAWVALVDPKVGDRDPAKAMGIHAAMVSDWQELRRNPAVDPRKAKSRDQLKEEIVDQLMNDGGGVPALLKILIGLSSEFHGTHGLLLPTLQVHAAPVPADLSEEEQHKLQGQSTAGQVFDVPLVDVADRTER